MGAVISLKEAQQVSRAQLPMLLHGDPWQAATEAQRMVAGLRYSLIKAAQDRDYSACFGAEWLAALLAAGNLPTASQDAAQTLLSRGDGLAEGTLKRWLSDYQRSGINGLLPKHTGRVRQQYGWEAQAIALYNHGSNRSYAAVAKELRYEYDFESASESRVKRYLKALPARLGSQGIARVGPHLHKLTMQKYQARHLDNLRAGDSYVGDGHTIDCYVAHPNTGKLWRPELSFFLDLKSRLPVGWWLGESENVVDTLRALGHAIARFDHVMPMLYLDHGAGYRAKMMSAEGVGFASQMGIDIMAAIPGNPHGKGWVEAFFRRVRDEHDKFFAGGDTYCGDDMADEYNRRISADVKSGKRKLPNFYDYKASLAKYLERVSHEAWEVLEGQTPAQVWAQSFVRIPAVFGIAELIRPMDEATVARQMVTLHKRTYYHGGLIDYQGQRVRVRYDLHDDTRVWICDSENRLICVAELTHKVAAIPTSRIEEARQTAEKKAVERKQYQIDEIKARNRDPITAESQLSEMPVIVDGAAAELLPAAAKRLPKPSAPAVEIDLLNWRKDA
jgi:putative transposase